MPKETPPTDLKLNDFLCFAVYAVGHGFNRVYKPLLEPLGLTHPQYLVTTALWERDDQTVGALGERLSLECNMLTPLLKRLESQGRIRRVRDPRDERQVRVQLTDGGALAGEAARIPHCILEASGLSLEDLGRLRRQITELHKALERYADSKAEG
jgi:MarR family transcriptional regulator, organic hydroperoxide resistance regulator